MSSEREMALLQTVPIHESWVTGIGEHRPQSFGSIQYSILPPGTSPLANGALSEMSLESHLRRSQTHSWTPQIINVPLYPAIANSVPSGENATHVSSLPRSM